VKCELYRPRGNNVLLQYTYRENELCLISKSSSWKDSVGFWISCEHDACDFLSIFYCFR